MKRAVIVLVAVLLIGMLCVPAFAAQSLTLTLEPSKTIVQPGEQITVQVRIDGDSPCTALGVIFSYDKEALEIISGECVYTDADLYDFKPETGGVMGFSQATVPAGAIFRFVLLVKPEAKPGQLQISGRVSAKNLNDTVAATMQDLILTVQTGSDEPSGNQSDIIGDVDIGDIALPNIKPSVDNPKEDTQNTTGEAQQQQTQKQQQTDKPKENQDGVWVYAVLGVALIGLAICGICMSRRKTAE